MDKLIVILLLLSAGFLNTESALAFNMPSTHKSSFFDSFFTDSFPFPSKTPKPSKQPSSSPVPTKFEILDVEPSSVNYMEEFTISGGMFGPNPGSVNFRYYTHNYVSEEAVIVSWSDTEIKAKVPALKKGSYRIQVVRADGQKSNEVKLNIKNGQPVINSTSISAVNGDYQLTFAGSELGKKGSVDIYNGDTLVGNGDIRYWSSTRVKFDLPELSRAQYGFVIVVADGRETDKIFFTVGN